ncbi:MAG: hypothetical protein E6Q97_27725 [Desulfurellales bacterium]|nr:MAG: hypothetical protein E6Q97_27725 [Desulfurellales bacterium]
MAVATLPPPYKADQMDAWRAWGADTRLLLVGAAIIASGGQARLLDGTIDRRNLRDLKIVADELAAMSAICRLAAHIVDAADAVDEAKTYLRRNV